MKNRSEIFLASLLLASCAPEATPPVVHRAIAPVQRVADVAPVAQRVQQDLAVAAQSTAAAQATVSRLWYEAETAKKQADAAVVESQRLAKIGSATGAELVALYERARELGRANTALAVSSTELRTQLESQKTQLDAAQKSSQLAQNAAAAADQTAKIAHAQLGELAAAVDASVAAQTSLRNQLGAQREQISRLRRHRLWLALALGACGLAAAAWVSRPRILPFL